MPFISHTNDEINQMLQDLGLNSLNELFKEIPDSLQISSDSLTKVPEAITEMELHQLMQKISKKDNYKLNFLGGGSYEHYIPAAIWDVASRGEFLTAYTPYQAEASQGTLQLLYEYQTMISNLMSMDCANASLYDGASSLAEAVLMAVRLKKSNEKKILVPATINPLYRKVLSTIVSHQNIELIEIPYCNDRGNLDLSSFENIKDYFAAIIIPQPNFFGVLEEVDQLTDWAHARGALVIGVVNPIAMSLISPPGEWGEKGADIACGEGQPLGIPMSSGGPYFGFMCCKKEYVRQLPGRIIGRTTDTNGKIGYVLTLQAREQHIRRSKATSNICTNQGLLVTVATIYMSLLGAKGLQNVAISCNKNKIFLKEQLAKISDVEIIFDGNSFHELVLKFNVPVDVVINKMLHDGIQAGINLEQFYPELKNCMLVCVTETKSEEDINVYTNSLKLTLASCREKNFAEL